MHANQLASQVLSQLVNLRARTTIELQKIKVHEKRIVTISPYPTRSVYSWLSPKFSPEMCPSLVCREGYL